MKNIESMLQALLAAGQATGDVGIVRKGEQIILPENMEIPEAIDWLKKKNELEMKMVSFYEVIDGFPYDVARALGLAIKQKFGFASMADFWPKSISIPIDADGSMEQVYIGAFGIPSLENSQISTRPTSPVQLRIECAVRQRDRSKVKELMALTRKILKEHSVYKGNPIKLSWNEANSTWDEPKFIKTIEMGQLQVNDDTKELLEFAVWTPIMMTAECRKEKIPLKRGIQLEGPYGTGKSLFATETAALCKKHGWTFILLEDVNLLEEAYKFAMQYQPAVVFAEDIDTVMIQGATGWELPEGIRNTIDGVDTKSVEIILVLTTNHKDKLPASLLRPGRLDAVIPFREPNEKTVGALIRQYAGDLLPVDDDITSVQEKLNGQIASVIREVVERAKLRMISRKGKRELKSSDLNLAADSMVHQLSLLNAQQPRRKSFAEQFGEGVGNTVGGHLALAINNIKNGRQVPDDYVKIAEQAITAP